MLLCLRWVIVQGDIVRSFVHMDRGYNDMRYASVFGDEREERYRRPVVGRVEGLVVEDEPGSLADGEERGGHR